MYKVPNRPQRTNQVLKPIYEPKTKQLKASIFFKYTEIYNNLPQTLKALPKTKFKNHLEIHIQDNKEYHTIPNTNANESDESE